MDLLRDRPQILPFRHFAQHPCVETAARSATSTGPVAVLNVA